MDLPLVTIIVLSWNGKEDTLETLETLRNVTYPSFQVIVVDNGSSDGSQKAIMQGFPEVVLIENGANYGFAGGNNIGISRALADGADAVLLLNNDVEVAPDFVGHLVTALYSDPEIGAVNPKIYYHSTPDLIWSAGGVIDYRNCTTYQRHLNEPDTGQAGKMEDVDFAIGCAIMVKREAIDRAGMMDPDFFIYYEEAEWCHRIRKAGCRVIYVPQSRIWHKVSRSMSDKSSLMLYYFSRNRLLFGRKCGLSHLQLLRAATCRLGRIAVGHLVHGRFAHSRIILKAVLDFYRGRCGEARV